ncbi:putative RNA helicase [Heterostelium album PN500]|uniref:RNA helicase n=1 Tax=Heterostelium pallidum (strain ATCC 26659 / Pp 5 / PN500) TaxID=670386 RepID=D3BBD1_HETP5|nr:putative RNA helicase [Heterostelium album PN500]EFA81338.1 putative RNA helicase [Heterostelium album PN500]|eukprot:XP_020433456.1 putative RNA helicase [Heterostelium album PN500]
MDIDNAKRKRSSRDRDEIKSSRLSSNSSPHSKDGRKSKEVERDRRDERDRGRDDRDRDYRRSGERDRDRDRERDRGRGDERRGDDRDRDRDYRRSGERDRDRERDYRRGDERDRDYRRGDDRDRYERERYEREKEYRRGGGDYRDEGRRDYRDDLSKRDDNNKQTIATPTSPTRTLNTSTTPTTTATATATTSISTNGSFSNAQQQQQSTLNTTTTTAKTSATTTIAGQQVVSSPPAAVVTTPPVPVTPPVDPEVLKKQREEEKQKEQERLEEEMRKRREKVEQWRKEKERELQAQQAAAAALLTSTTTATTTTTTTKTKEWSLEEDEEDETKEKDVKDVDMKDISQQQLLPPLQKISQQNNNTTTTTTSANQKEEEEEEEDPLDAFMNQLMKSNNNTNKADGNGGNGATTAAANGNGNGTIVLMKAKRLEDGDEADFEEESEDENEQEKEVKKGKRELLSTDHSSIDYPAFEKNFYIEVPTLSNMTDTEVLDYRSELGIKITGKNCPKPVLTWAQCGLPEKIHQLLKKNEYEKPTPIQAQTIPAIMSGRNIIGIARTGSGKTLAFLLPMFRHVLSQDRPKQGEGMVGLIMSPTRELALQIYSECKKFSKVLGLRVCCVYGGANIGEQIADLKRGADIVVCTPGRMIDILCANNKRITNLRRVSFLVLDEADRMFDLGFGPQIMCIIDNVRPDRQTVMFSATFPFKVEQVARKILVKPLEIIAGGRSIVCSDVEQVVEVRPSETRYRRLIELLATWYHKGQILIFTNKQDATDNLFGLLSRAGYQCLSLHGSKDQTDRDETISDFKNKIKTILIATPLASRGLDVKDLNLVINYDCPDHLEDYVHRVGRTGRAGNKGTAYTFVLPDEGRFAPSIIKALEQSGAKVPEELTKLGAEYQRLRQEGKEVMVASSGFGGRGHKFDAAEEDKKKEERKLQKKAYGIEDDEEEDESAVSASADLDTKSPTATTSPTNSSVAGDSSNTVGANNPSSATSNVPPPAAMAAAAAMLQSIDPSLPAGQQAIKQILGTGVQITSEAAIKAAQLAASLAAKPAPSSKVVSNAHSTTFQEEIEINDYSQQARWKVTHKDALAQIIEHTATAVTTKGTYFPPNKQPAANEKKLYLLIEGPSEAGVRTAKLEIKKILDEVQAHSDKGKYSVF